MKRSFRWTMRDLAPKLAAGLFGLAILSPSGARAQTAYSIRTGSYGPSGNVVIAKPTFRWQIWPSHPSVAIVSVGFTLDGKAVTATYDREARVATARLDAPLAPGPHKAAFDIRWDNGMDSSESWSFQESARTVDVPAMPTAGQLEVLAAVNKIRAAYGLPPAHLDDALDAAAMAHSSYLSTNQMTGHEEKPNTPGFVGATSADRVSAYGWVGGSWEVVSFGDQTPNASVESLFNAPYHRVPFLQVGTPSIGAGFVDQRLTLEFESTADTGTAVSPPNGAIGVPCSWHDFERPNPVRFYGGAGTVTGYPIVIAHFAPGLPRLTKMFGWLNGPDQKDVPCWINTPLNDDILRCAAILIPKSPLRPNSVYHAGFDGRDATGATVRTEITFTTGR